MKEIKPGMLVLCVEDISQDRGVYPGTAFPVGQTGMVSTIVPHDINGEPCLVIEGFHPRDVDVGIGVLTVQAQNARSFAPIEDEPAKEPVRVQFYYPGHWKITRTTQEA